MVQGPKTSNITVPQHYHAMPALVRLSTVAPCCASPVSSDRITTVASKCTQILTPPHPPPSHCAIRLQKVVLHFIQSPLLTVGPQTASSRRIHYLSCRPPLRDALYTAASIRPSCRLTYGREGREASRCFGRRQKGKHHTDTAEYQAHLTVFPTLERENNALL